MFHAEIKSRPDEDFCLLVRPDNHAWNYLCDCGDAGDLTVKECQDTRAIFISHTHFDHFANFDWIVRHQIGSGGEVILCGPPQIACQVQARLRSYTWNLVDPEAIRYQVREVIDEQTVRRFMLLPPQWELKVLSDSAGPAIYSCEEFRVDFTILDHKIPSIAYRFQEYDTVKIDMAAADFPGGSWIRSLKAAYADGDAEEEIAIGDARYRAGALFHLLYKKPGDSLGVIMDHAAHAANHQRIRQRFGGCRRVFIESFYRETDRQLARQHAHSYSAASGRVMKACGVAEAIPVHFSRKYEAPELEKLRAEFEKAYLDG